jgi:hypothetical protein
MTLVERVVGRAALVFFFDLYCIKGVREENGPKPMPIVSTSEKRLRPELRAFIRDQSPVPPRPTPGPMPDPEPGPGSDPDLYPPTMPPAPEPEPDIFPPSMPEPEPMPI